MALDESVPITDELKRWLGAGLLAVIGGVVALLHLMNEAVGLLTGAEPPLFAVGFPLLLSALLVFAGYWIYRSDLTADHVLLVGGWTTLGTTTLAAAGVLIILYQLGQGVLMADRWVVIANNALAGASIGVVVGLYDAQGRVARSALQRRERTLSTLMSNLPGTVYRARNEPDWPMEFVSEGCVDLTGYDPDRLVDGEVSWGEDVVADHHEEVWAEVQAAIEERRPFQTEYPIRTATGERRWVWEQGRGVFDADGDLLTVEGFVTDVTDRKERQSKVESLHATSRALLGAETPEAIAEAVVSAADEVLGLSLTGFWLYDGDGDRLEPATQTPSATELFGAQPAFGPGDGLVRAAFEAGEPRTYDDLQAVEGVYNDDTPLRTEAVFPLGDHGVLAAGSTAPEGFDEYTVSLLRILAANAEAALDRAEREALLRERERELEDERQKITFLNGLLRHNILNGMNIVAAKAELLKPEVTADQRSHLETITNRSDDIVELIRKIRMLVRSVENHDATDLEPVDLSAVLESELADARSAFTGAVFEADVPEGLEVEADEMLSEVFENLLNNAVQHNEADTPEVTVEVEETDDRAVVTVRDNGPGISDDRKEAIFSKGEQGPESLGTGFGLYIVDMIVDRYDGDISVADNEPTGAEFRVGLPAA